jgi:hypothetical protein
MKPIAVFGLSILMSFLSAGVVGLLYAWPRLRVMGREQALLALVAPHCFLRFLGLSLLVPGVVSPSLPAAFSEPAAYGDLIAGLLALIAMVALLRHSSRSTPAVWLFNTWGAADFLFAFYQGLRLQIDPGALGAAFFILTAIVPPLFVTHLFIFRLLISRQMKGEAYGVSGDGGRVLGGPTYPARSRTA